MSVQIDVNINMTLEISDGEWEAFQDNEDPALEAAMFALDGEEIAVVDGRAWVCSVDSASLL